MFPPFSRRCLLTAAAALVPVLRSHPAWGLCRSPLTAAIGRAEAADAAFLRSGRLSDRMRANGSPLSADWMAYRERLRERRRVARYALHVLTPATPDEAAALVAYYTGRAMRSGDHKAMPAALRRLRKVFKRPGACRPP